MTESAVLNALAAVRCVSWRTRECGGKGNVDRAPPVCGPTPRSTTPPRNSRLHEAPSRTAVRAQCCQETCETLLRTLSGY